MTALFSTKLHAPPQLLSNPIFVTSQFPEPSQPSPMEVLPQQVVETQLTEELHHDNIMSHLATGEITPSQECWEHCDFFLAGSSAGETSYHCVEEIQAMYSTPSIHFPRTMDHSSDPEEQQDLDRRRPSLSTSLWPPLLTGLGPSSAPTDIVDGTKQWTSRKKQETRAGTETMEAEAAVQSNKDEAKELKAKEQRMTLVFGTADLKNGAHYCVEEKEDKLQSCRNEKCHEGTKLNNIDKITVPLYAMQKRMNVPYQMLLLLEEMQRGKRKAVHPTELACCLSAHRVDLFVQHDAAQLFLRLWNLIKKQMKKLELVEELSDLYTICIEEHLACENCSFETKSNSSMLTLPLPVLDSNSHRLKSLSMKLVHLPQTLTIHLKRFCFEKSSYTHKLSHYLPFPQDLDFNRVLTGNQCQADDNEKASWQYGLFAVVAHSGSTSSGHYCAYIKSLTECKWYCFNDSEVCQVSWDDVKCTYGHASLYWYANIYLFLLDAALDFGMRTAERRKTVV
ncbi:ubiquitin specific peptidase 18 [Willisornis vidua]|uniref:Ubiquitin specific peptidase 18 n=1 Tax=Willisornis vidua TaxID=1566151 RepID=A0ABQ9DK72_9PASS|nr:ubiquitin specific peptidase 18 [Willisornis vidua]